MAAKVVLSLLLALLILVSIVNSAPPRRPTPVKPKPKHDGLPKGPDIPQGHKVHVKPAEHKENPDESHDGDEHVKEEAGEHQPQETHHDQNAPKLDIKSKAGDLNAGVIKLDEHPDCAEDVQRLCHEVPKGRNFEILVCIQEKALEDEISNACHNLLWHYKKNLTCDARFESAAKKLCDNDLQKLPYCKRLGETQPGKGKLVPCLLEHRQNVTDARCKHMMTKMQAIVFSNYHLIDGFFEDCQADVQQHHCGRITEMEADEDIHSQNEVVECLEKYQEDLSAKCQKQIYRMAELSSDDYHLDRPLFYACRADREKFCAETPAGEGRIYKCLKEHKFEQSMSKECEAMITYRQKIISQDVKADYGLLTSCQKEFEKYKDKYNCEAAAKGKTMHGGLAVMILCLEKALNDGLEINEKCQSELFETRQQLMEDYSINPEIVAQCDKEIEQHCTHEKTVKEGKTLDCLMRLAEEGKGDIRPSCQKAVHNLIKETGAGGDYRIDHTLYQACEPVVQTQCKDKGKKEGDVMILSCLMEHLNSDVMNHQCREQLLHLQFFIARDFSLDPDLFQACSNDAKKVCHAKSFSEDSDEVPNGMIISCLYRNSFHSGELKVSDDCANHVRRVMHQRALDVHLIPEVQESCMRDLGQHCSSNIEKGQEVECLQTNLEKLSPKCKAVISNFTEEEGEDYQLDHTLVRMCSAMVPKFCEDIVTKGDSEGVLPCLIEHKNDPGMDDRCKASIQHWQLIEMKDFTFSAQFKKACIKDVERHCKDKTKTKHDIVKCLSEKVRDAVIKSEKHIISKKCRAELRVAEEEEGEDIRLNPDLYGVCTNDVQKFCKDVQPGQAKILECLKDHFDELSQPCQKELFKREEEEAREPDIDYQLVKSCQQSIEQFCSDVDPQELLSCLEKNKGSPKMSKACRNIVNKRQKKQYEDYRLDPELQSACKKEIHKFCSNIAKPGDGAMVDCLKTKLVKGKLGENCEMYIRSVVHEEAKDYRLDPKLSKSCAGEVNEYCSDIEPGHGKVEECLRKNIEKMKESGKSRRCHEEVIRTMHEGQTDVYADPVLHDACYTDIKHHCDDVDPGSGRIMNCLIGVKTSKPHRLRKKCTLQLQARLKMWDFANIQAPESLSDLAAAIRVSPSKNYFFMVFAIALTLIFVGGLVFGRISKKVKREIKDR